LIATLHYQESYRGKQLTGLLKAGTKVINNAAAKVGQSYFTVHIQKNTHCPAINLHSRQNFASRDTNDKVKMPDLAYTIPAPEYTSEIVQGFILDLPHWEVKEKLK
jgi:hypothetical protein